LEELGLASDHIGQVVGYADRKLRVPDDPMSSENRRISILIMNADGNNKKGSS
jgi:chemotaxis protein MotB